VSQSNRNDRSPAEHWLFHADVQRAEHTDGVLVNLALGERYDSRVGLASLRSKRTATVTEGLRGSVYTTSLSQSEARAPVQGQRGPSRRRRPSTRLDQPPFVDQPGLSVGRARERDWGGVSLEVWPGVASLVALGGQPSNGPEASPASQLGRQDSSLRFLRHAESAQVAKSLVCFHGSHGSRQRESVGRAHRWCHVPDERCGTRGAQTPSTRGGMQRSDLRHSHGVRSDRNSRSPAGTANRESAPIAPSVRVDTEGSRLVLGEDSTP
jgi:hypothetical protein